MKRIYFFKQCARESCPWSSKNWEERHSTGTIPSPGQHKQLNQLLTAPRQISLSKGRVAKAPPESQTLIKTYKAWSPHCYPSGFAAQAALPAFTSSQWKLLLSARLRGHKRSLLRLEPLNISKQPSPHNQDWEFCIPFC